MFQMKTEFEERVQSIRGMLESYVKQCCNQGREDISEMKIEYLINRCAIMEQRLENVGIETQASTALKNSRKSR